MKIKTLIIATAFVLWPSFSMAAALYCDYQDGVIAADVEVEKVSTNEITMETVAPTIEGSEFRLIPVDGYAPGAYIFRVRFIGKGGFPGE